MNHVILDYPYVRPEREQIAPTLHERVARESDYTTIVNEDTTVYINDESGRTEPVFVYLANWMNNADCAWLMSRLAKVEFGRSARTGRMASTSRTFGYMPRRALYQDFCYSSRFNSDYPPIARRLFGLAKRAGDELEKHNPVVAGMQSAVLEEQVLEQWKLPGGMFSSGIINKDTALMYHRDAGNYDGSWSAMLGLKDGIRENTGMLVVPELLMAFQIGLGSLTMFAGKEWYHAVTPIQHSRHDGVRYTIVFYPLQQMCHCGTVEQEVARQHEKRTLQEMKRAYQGGAE